MPEARAFLGLGANLGEPAVTIAEALTRLKSHGVEIIARSVDYQTPPWGKSDQPAFVNACAEVATDRSPIELLRLCQSIETALGRTRTEKWGPRTIDIDLLVYDDLVIETPELTVPHPLMLERAFVLVPLLDIAPDLVVRGQPIGASLAKLDRTGIERLSA